MTARFEWRTRAAGADVVLLVSEYGEAGDTVMISWPADGALLADFLNDMQRLDSTPVRLGTAVDQRDPEQWGKLVLSRASPGGDVLNIDPEAYWDGIYYWFRSRGLDPHPWHRASNGLPEHARSTISRED
jgi:hypothetical protein